MNDWLKKIIRATGFATAIAVPSPLIAGRDFAGVWQPYSDPVMWLGAMTVESDRLSFERGPSARLVPVRSDGSVFRVITTKDDTIVSCKGGANEYVAFHILDNGLLALLHYSADKPTTEPKGSNSMEVTRNRACSVTFLRVDDESTANLQ